ncbi:DUF2871 domain-containing protein [uncultured Tessaracoccus sp.]|uniref:DUF2871 domain-containing protein n=1 Tax=uncultured Tessaracoccus sp. TaxID=905023 RepID=UPI0025F6BDC6|nr:DUF2871 domain-containing protein [uncultured Tessaracoccus sp.]
MKKLWYAASFYAAVGLVSGLVYRTLTAKMTEIPKTQLATTHTHFLALGMMMMLIVLALDAALGIAESRSFGVFFWTYNAGLVITGGVMIWHGLIQLDGGTGGAMIAGIAGIGHILLTVAVVALMVALARPIKLAAERRAVEPATH